MKVKDIIGAIEEFAPLRLQEEWDNSGLLIGSEDSDIESVLVGFDCTPDLIAEAVSTGSGMVVTHHPLIFRGLKKIDESEPVGAAVAAAIRGNIAVYASHTPSDKVLGGVSGAMARRLGLEDIRALDPEEDGTGLGAVGDLTIPMTPQEALEMVREKLELPVLRASAPICGQITRIAMCGGSGSSLAGKARSCGAQLYLTGDVSYHDFATPEGFMIADVGHFESEVEIVSILFSVIRKKFPNFAVRISEGLRESNPVRYIL